MSNTIIWIWLTNDHRLANEPNERTLDNAEIPNITPTAVYVEVVTAVSVLLDDSEDKS